MHMQMRLGGAQQQGKEGYVYGSPVLIQYLRQHARELAWAAVDEDVSPVRGRRLGSSSYFASVSPGPAHSGISNVAPSFPPNRQPPIVARRQALLRAKVQQQHPQQQSWGHAYLSSYQGPSLGLGLGVDQVQSSHAGDASGSHGHLPQLPGRQSSRSNSRSRGGRSPQQHQQQGHHYQRQQTSGQGRPPQPHGQPEAAGGHSMHMGLLQPRSTAAGGPHNPWHLGTSAENPPFQSVRSTGLSSREQQQRAGGQALAPSQSNLSTDTMRTLRLPSIGRAAATPAPPPAPMKKAQPAMRRLLAPRDAHDTQRPRQHQPQPHQPHSHQYQHLFAATPTGPSRAVVATEEGSGEGATDCSRVTENGSAGCSSPGGAFESPLLPRSLAPMLLYAACGESPDIKGRSGGGPGYSYTITAEGIRMGGGLGSRPGSTAVTMGLQGDAWCSIRIAAPKQAPGTAPQAPAAVAVESVPQAAVQDGQAMGPGQVGTSLVPQPPALPPGQAPRPLHSRPGQGSRGGRVSTGGGGAAAEVGMRAGTAPPPAAAAAGQLGL